ncbi:Alpha-glucan water dikinase 2, partial [Mucuna pruriens]
MAPPRVLHFDLIEGMQLAINISGSLEKRNVRIDFQLKNCTRTWILHWGFVFNGNKNWFIPAGNSSGGKSYKQGALQSQFTKNGQIYVLIIELRDPSIHAIELKLNHSNFQIEIPASDAPVISHSGSSTPKDLIEHKAHSQSEGRPISLPQQQKQHYDSALRELPNHLSKGITLNESRNNYPTGGIKPVNDNRDQLRSGMRCSHLRQHNIEDWLQKHSEGYAKGTISTAALVEDSIGGTDVMSRQIYHVHNYEIMVFSKTINGDNHIFVAANTNGTTVLHWGICKFSPSEWLVPPQEIWPENSKLVSGACQSYFREKFLGNRPFQVIYASALFHTPTIVDSWKRNFAGIQFVICTGGYWIKNNGANFFAELKPINPTEKPCIQFTRDAKEVVLWLLDEISRREKEAERSLMHRFNIATELTDRCKTEGELGLIGILVWIRFMACRHLTWNKNYNVKPRNELYFICSEISEAQDRFTNLLKIIYLNQPSNREIVRLIMMCVGPGGQGDAGQRIRDEILLIQRNNDCKTGMMEEWHQKLHNNSSPDDVIICEALLSYARCGFRIDVYWKTLNANGLTREKLASYDRPIVSEPHFRTDMRDRLIHDLTAYLKILKAVYTGVDLGHAIDVCLGSSFKKLLESRIELRPVLLTSHRRLKDLLFLDISLDSAVRTTVEKGLKNVNFANPLDWYRICESYKSGNGQWALQTKAILDRLQLVLAERSQYYHKRIQPSAQYLGNLLGVPKWTVISAVEVSGFVTFVNELITAQDKVYRRPTIIIASKITGDEEIPEGAVAVLTADTPDICFATCFDPNVYWDLKSKEGKAISIKLKSNNLVIREINSSSLSHTSTISFSIPRGVTFKKKKFCGNYAASIEEFTGEMVGAKSCNIKLLWSRVPSWIKIPMSVALPFGAFEIALQDKDMANKIAMLCKSVHNGDLSRLKAVQEAILQMNAPPSLTYELKHKIRSSRLPWPGDEGNERWSYAWQAIKKVWASKWNERAFLSCQKAKLNHENICMAVLIQEVICGDYAFVIHTKNPLSGDSTEIYAEIVKGLGETLVGAYPGRAMTFIVKKTNLKSPMVTSYPSKLTGLYSKKSIIFRSDSNSEDLEGFAGAGLFDSVIIDKVEKVVLDYSKDPIVTDKPFQTSLFSRIAEAGKIIEDLYACPQDIEGVVKDGTIFVVQARPQI